MITDDSLVREAQSGRSDAFDRLMRRYEKLVCKVALGYVREKEQALDVTQNVFLKAFRNLDSVQAEGMFKPWLLRITYNESINWLRKRKRSTDREVSSEQDAIRSADPGPESGIERGERQRLLLAGLAALNPKYRMAVALRYADGLRIREIATTMGCSEGMVKSLLFRGVRQIRDRVATATREEP